MEESDMKGSDMEGSDREGGLESWELDEEGSGSASLGRRGSDNEDWGKKLIAFGVLWNGLWLCCIRQLTILVTIGPT